MASGSKSGWFADEPEVESRFWPAEEPEVEEEAWSAEDSEELSTGEDDAWYDETAEEDADWDWEWEWVEEPAEGEPEWESGGYETPVTGQEAMPAAPPPSSGGPAPGSPPPAPSFEGPTGGAKGRRGGAPGGPTSGEPLAAPGQERSPEEEREVVTDFAMQQLAEDRGHAATVPLGGADTRSPEEMRDQALQQYMQKKEQFDRERQEKAERQRRAAERAAAEAAAALDEVKGLNSTTQERILEHYGSVQALQSASVEELTEIQGVGKATAQRIQEAVAG